MAEFRVPNDSAITRRRALCGGRVDALVRRLSSRGRHYRTVNSSASQRRDYHSPRALHGPLRSTQRPGAGVRRSEHEASVSARYAERR